MAKHSEHKDIQVLKYERKMPTSEKLLYIIAILQLINLLIIIFK
jgi:hypothetical protein